MAKDIKWLDREIEKDNKFLEKEKLFMICQIKNLDKKEIFKEKVVIKQSIFKKIMKILFNK